MFSIKNPFNCAAHGSFRISVFVLILLAFSIDDSRQHAENRRKKRACAPKPQTKPAGPNPF